MPATVVSSRLLSGFVCLRGGKTAQRQERKKRGARRFAGALAQKTVEPRGFCCLVMVRSDQEYK